MSKPKTSYNSLEPQDQLTCDIIEEFLGERSWRLFEDDPIPSTANRLQVRNQKEVARPVDVDRFSLAYQRENPVPAIVVTSDGSEGGPRLLIDGSTRAEGRLRATTVMKWPAQIRQFVLNVDPDRLDDVTRGQLYMLGLALNGTNGTPMTLRNIADVLTIAVPHEDNISAAALAAMVRCSPSTIVRVRDLRKAEARAERLGIPIEAKGDDDKGGVTLSDSHLVMLGQKEQKISDRIYADVVQLVRQAKLSTNEMKVLFSDLQASYDDKSRLATITRWRKENSDRIAGRATRPTAARRLVLVLGQLEAIDIKSTVETQPALFDTNLGRLYAAKDKIEEMIKAQLETSHSRGPVTVPPQGR